MKSFAIVAIAPFLMFATGVFAQLEPAPPAAAPDAPAPPEPAPVPLPAIPKGDAAKLDRMLTLLEEGNLGSIHALAQPYFESATPRQLADADQYLAHFGVNQSLEKLVLNARLQLVMEGQGKRVRRPGPKELGVVLKYLVEETGKLLAPVEKEAKTGLPPVIPHEIIDERLERIPDLMQQADQAVQVFDHLTQLTRRLKPQDVNGLDDESKALAEENWKDHADSIEPLKDQLAERIVALGLMQLRDMMVVLQNLGNNYRVRFEASQRIRKALLVLDTHWKQFERRKLRDPAMALPGTLAKEVERSRQAFRTLAGEMEQKTFLLEEGTRWWIRGRFGQGPLDGGLAKAVPQGVRNLDHTLLYYPLWLPNPIPVPPDPNKNPLNIPVARRHIQYWVAEGSLPSVSIRMDNFTVDQADPNWPKEALGAREFQQLMNKLDFNPASVPLVGYLEYQMALLYFEYLLRVCNDAEIQAIDEMVAEDDRLVVHSNLSRRYNRFAQDSTLQFEFVRTTDPRAKGEYERRGLKWMMALARLEMGAMIAARIPAMRRPNRTVVTAPLQPGQTRINGTTIRNADGTLQIVQVVTTPNPHVELDPFSIWPPTAFEHDAFTELLWDAARQHYYSLRTEFIFVPTGRSDISQIGKILVRFAVASEIIKATAQVSGNRMTAAQRKESEFWLKWIEEVRIRAEQSMGPQFDATGQPIQDPRIIRSGTQ